jgi:hypothetical protein
MKFGKKTPSGPASFPMQKKSHACLLLRMQKNMAFHRYTQ